jgi:hypothetical protein
LRQSKTIDPGWAGGDIPEFGDVLGTKEDSRSFP